MPALVAQRKPVALLCQSAAGGATRRFGRAAASGVDPWFPLNHDTGVTIRESSWPVKCIFVLALGGAFSG